MPTASPTLQSAEQVFPGHSPQPAAPLLPGGASADGIADQQTQPASDPATLPPPLGNLKARTICLLVELKVESEVYDPP